MGFEAYERVELGSEGGPDDFYRERVDRISRALQEVTDVESPIHVDEAFRRVAGAWEISRVTSKVQDVLESALTRAERSGRLVRRGSFLWSPTMDTAPVRHRGEDDPRDIALVAPEEITEAVRLVLRKEFSMGKADLVGRVARVLGYARTGARLRSTLEETVESLARQGLLLELGGTCRLPGGPPALEPAEESREIDETDAAPAETIDQG